MWIACAPKVELPPAYDPEGVANEVVSEGPLKRRIADVQANLVVHYVGEHHGSMETCGCPERPRGSLARLASYLDAARTDHSVLVHGGYFLSDLTNTDLTLRGDVPAQNRWMVEGLRAFPWDALHVTARDLVGLGDVDTAGLPLVSLNVTGPGVAPWVVVERGGKRVGITGVTGVGLGFEPPAGWQVAPPDSVVPRLAELAAKTDVVVLSVYADAEAARRLRAAVPEVDVILDVAQHRDALPAARIGSTVWAFSPYETLRVGELHLDLANHRALDRKIDLDPQVPDRVDLDALQEQARTEIAAVQAEVL